MRKLNLLLIVLLSFFAFALASCGDKKSEEPTPDTNTNPNDTNLDEEKYDIISGLKRFVNGPFICIKHVKEGSIFVDENSNMYLVKGIKTGLFSTLSQLYKSFEVARHIDSE